MNLYRDGKLFGGLSNYFYETPWATAILEPVDADAFKMLCQVSYLLNVVPDELKGSETDGEEETRYERWLDELGILEADVDQFQASEWAIDEPGQPDQRAVVTLYECEKDGWIRWRW